MVKWYRLFAYVCAKPFAIYCEVIYKFLFSSEENKAASRTLCYKKLVRLVMLTVGYASIIILNENWIYSMTPNKNKLGHLCMIY